MKSYAKHLESRQQVGVKLDKHYKPVFRSSAIFPVLQNTAISSEILFMGYWLIKRNIKEVSVLITLRNQKGILLERRSILVDCVKSFRLELRDLLPSELKETAFEGSIDLEVFSSVDLVFPYPAFVVNYYGEGFSTAVHTTGRIYNDIEDLKEHTGRKVAETGFDIHATEQLEPFFAFVNGVVENPTPTITYTLVNAQQEVQKGTFQLPPLQAYETAFVHLNQHIEGLVDFLDGHKGTIKIHHNFEGFFPRLIAGNFQYNPDLISVTHTYYDCSSCNLPEDYWNRDLGAHHACSVVVPIFNEGDWYSELVFYPIFSPSTYTLDLEFFDKNGQLLKKIEQFEQYQANELKTIAFDVLLAEKGWSDLPIVSVRLITHWKDNILPTRLKLGLNVGNRSRAAQLPCNICFAPKIGDPRTDQKKSTFKWSPIINRNNSVLVFQNSPTHKHSYKEANVTIKFFREQDEQYLERQIILNDFGSAIISTDEDTEIRDFLQGGSGWVTALSDNPYLIGWYFDCSEHGAVAGDHSF